MKTYQLTTTKHPDLFRVEDRDGNWKHYFHKPSGKYLRGTTTILDEGYPKSSFLINFLTGISKDERDRMLSSAGEKGDQVHRTIDILLTMEGAAEINRETGIFKRRTKEEEALSNDAWDALLSFQAFWKDHAPVLFTSEFSVFNLETGYAGTGDVLMMITKECGGRSCGCKGNANVLLLSDWKTSSGIRDSYWSQIASYAKADNLGDYTKGQPLEGLAIVRLGTSHKNGGYEFKVCRDVETEWQNFLAAKRLADYNYKPFDPETEIVDIPDVISIEVQHFVAPPAAPTLFEAPVEKPKKAKTPKKVKEPGTLPEKKSKKKAK